MLPFLGGNFRGVRHFWGDPYFNSTTILFDNTAVLYDNYILKIPLALWQKQIYLASTTNQFLLNNPVPSLNGVNDQPLTLK